MKITHNKVGQNLNTGEGVKTERTKGGSATAAIADNDKMGSKLSDLGASKVEVSPRAQDAKRIKEIAMSAPDVDEAKVAKFRQMIDEGSYKIDAKGIADRMVDEHLSMEDMKNG
ncbi:MAG: flagellar biosynthesis anti-sigma factor FlgM [Proteobacteria bacterium]|nr:MAG: flagellar biosynthesis anti-sigma factor FlgM [Pseudomonadota bacterium]